MNEEKILLALKSLEDDLDQESVSELVQDFLQEAPVNLEEIQSLISRGPSAELTRAAHSLKGCCSIYRAEELVQLCQQLETASRSGHAEAFSPTMVSLVQGIEELLGILKRYSAQNAR